jgi:mannan endo-1,4-beta-mannosidase
MNMQRKWMVAALAVAATAIIVVTAVQMRAEEGTSSQQADYGSESRAVHSPDGEDSAPDQAAREFDFVDPEATAYTKSLYAYLAGQRGKQILFGHQHATTESISSSTDPIQSEVKISTGDYPAIFGWDTLSIEGKEKPGIFGNAALSRERVIEKMQEAHELGGIVALSTHPPNFVTGGSFNDTTGNVVADILPGGSKHAEFNRYLDLIADVANNLKDKDGEPIPLLFRPFHEQNGGWFWWGARSTKTADYIALYRYTVEYLRDAKDVHNFLYVFSPNGPFRGEEADYMTTYPGDAYVDILGMDQYDSQENPGSKSFLDQLAADLAMINRLADARGKIAALSEYGYSPQGMKTTGNGDLAWFTKVLEAIKSDPDAKRTAYMQTWANFALDGNLFVPYKNAPGDHELLPDFIRFYEDDYTGFAQEVGSIYGRAVTALQEEPFLYLAVPTADTVLKIAPVQVRARLLHGKAEAVTLKVQGSDTVAAMTLDAEGYYTAEWTPDQPLLDGGTAELQVEAKLGGGKTLEHAVRIHYKPGSAASTNETIYDYESGTEEWTINNDNGGAWNTAKAAGVERTEAAAAKGKSSLKADFNLGGGSFELTRVGRLDLSEAASLSAKVKVAIASEASAGSGIRVKLFMKTGDSWAWMDSGENVLTGDGFTTIPFDIRNVSGKDFVQAIGLQVLSPDDASGTAAIYLDDVTMTME